MNKRHQQTNALAGGTQIVNVGGAIDLRPSTPNIASFNSYYTIEEHLYNLCHGTRFAYLWHNWNIEKQEYIKQLESVQNTYPDYSLHDKTHSEKVLVNIERVLGAERISELTVGDAWLILQCAYTHDLGMDVSENEKHLFALSPNSKKIVLTDDFKEELRKVINELRKRDTAYPISDNDIARHAADYWYMHQETIINDESFRKQVFGADFSLARYFYRVMTQLYFRKKHAERSRDKLLDKLYSNVEKDIIPRHMREAVAQIDFCHCDRPEIVIDTLKHRQNGFDSGDFIHPRFVAALLRIGDLLDVESTRFNSYIIDGIKNISDDNLAYMIKDLCVSEILVDPRSICVTANFETEQVATFLINQKYCGKDDVLKVKRLIARSIKYTRHWMGYVKQNITSFWMSWKDIAPRSFSGSLPSPTKLKIVYDGQEIDEGDLDLRYEIETTRAAEIIEGAGLYNNQLVFLREVIQNSIDATLVAIYRDHLKYVSRSSELSFPKFLKKYDSALSHHKINVDINCMKIESDQEVCFTVDITDTGIGISRKDLNNMRHIGAVKDSIWEDEIKNIFCWLQPTSDFGIGIQSAFLVSNQFILQSRPKQVGIMQDKQTQRRIIFNSTKYGGDITSIDRQVDYSTEKESWDDVPKSNYPFGTRFSISVNLSEHNDFTRSFASGKSYNKDSVFYGQNFPLMLKKKCIKFLSEQFTNSIIPIITTINGKEEKSCSFPTIPFAEAIGHEDIECLRIYEVENKIFYWHESGESSNPINVMFTFSTPSEEKLTNTKLFFRGIRFAPPSDDGYLPHGEIYEMIGTLGFDCSINIMSGQAHDFLEINRDKVKTESFGLMCEQIREGIEGFFSKIIDLISKITAEDGNENKLSLSLQSVLKESTFFVKQLYVYMLVKNIGNEKALEFLENIGNNLFLETAFINKTDKIIVVNNEKKMSECKNMRGNVSFVKSSKDRYFLHGDTAFPDYVPDTVVFDNLPPLLGLRFGKVTAFAKSGGVSDIGNERGVVSIYTLDEPFGENDTTKTTEMDVSSYELIIKDMLFVYAQKLKENKIDDCYFPIFPAPPFEKSKANNIHHITTSNFPADEDTYCDGKYRRFIMSPFPVSEVIKLKNTTKTGSDLLKGLVKDARYKEHYEQALIYLTDVLKSNHQSDNDLKEGVMRRWCEFANILCELLK